VIRWTIGTATITVRFALLATPVIARFTRQHLRQGLALLDVKFIEPVNKRFVDF